MVDACINIGRGQRQLILGDRSLGKTSIFLSIIITSNLFNYITTIHGFGSKRLFCIYIGINQNLSKLGYVIHYMLCSLLMIILSSCSSSSSLLSFSIPLIGISIAERLRDRGYDSSICFDDCSQHSKTYRQISLILAKIPSRDAMPADIFNIHSSLLERSGKLKYSLFGGSITALPVIETINSDITNFIATNIISITDGQLYLDKKLFLDSIRPSFDSGLSVSRIGSSAQLRSIKIISGGIKNTITIIRNAVNLNTASHRLIYCLTSLQSLILCSHLSIHTIELTAYLLLSYHSRLCSLTIPSLPSFPLSPYPLPLSLYYNYGLSALGSLKASSSLISSNSPSAVILIHRSRYLFISLLSSLSYLRLSDLRLLSYLSYSPSSSLSSFPLSLCYYYKDCSSYHLALSSSLSSSALSLASSSILRLCLISFILSFSLLPLLYSLLLLISSYDLSLSYLNILDSWLTL